MLNDRSDRRLSALRLLVRSAQTLLLLGLLSAAFPAESVAATACGSDGERGCCVASTERLSTGACVAGAIEVPGCVGDCACGGSGLAVFFGSSSSGTCAVPTSCGQDGERACCLTVGEPSWDDNPIPLSRGCFGTPAGGTLNLTEVAGGVPDPGVCGGANPFGWSSNGHCQVCGSDGAHACVGGNTTPLTECLPGLSKDAFDYCAVCGGEGQQLCAEQMCNPGYHQAYDLFDPQLVVCSADRRVAEPDCDCTPVALPTPDPQQPVVGYADLHLHMFSNLAFGGMVLWGDAYDEKLGISGALRADNFVQRNADFQINGHALSGINDTPVAPDLLRGATVLHGDIHANDIIELAQSSAKFGPNAGVEWDPNCLPPLCASPLEDFSGWPHWGTVTHQQAYFTWLQRAHRGGMQLTVMLAVTNEAMCAGGRHLDYPELDCEDTMASIKLQIRKAREFEEWNDSQCALGDTWSQDLDPGISAQGDVFVDRHCAQGGGPSGSGWFRIVEDPAAARIAIANGQLAVVLGIEESALFGYKLGLSDQFADIERQLQEFLGLGVRHIFPIHNFDNGFGGTATWNETIAVGHRYANRHINDWLDVESCPNTPSLDGSNRYGYKMYGEPFLNSAIGALSFGIDAKTYPLGNSIIGWAEGFAGTCNTMGLTPFGEGLIERLIDVGMIIDIDHMSNHSFNRTLEIAESHNYPGIVASHALMYDLHKEEFRHERMRTQPQLERIAALGGMIGVMTQPPPGDEREMIEDPNRANPLSTNDCEASSKSVSSAYEWAVKVMQPVFPVGSTFGVAFGTDFNGISQHNAPRFGPDACATDTAAAPQDIGTQVVYPFTIPGFGSFDEQQTSNRVFNFNTDGLAHIGLLPDMVKDMENSYLTGASDLDPLFNSAEAYLQMWEGAVGVADTVTVPPVTSDENPPTSRASVAGVPLGSYDWFTSPTTVDIDGADEAGGSGLAGFDLRESENTTRPIDNNGVNWPPSTDSSVTATTTSVSYATEGKWKLGVRAEDLAGNLESYRYYTIGVDWTPPTLTSVVTPPDNGSGWHNAGPVVSFTCFDALVGDALNCPADIDLSGVGDDVYDFSDRTATDQAGNVSDPSTAVVRLDTEAPVVDVFITSEFPRLGSWYRSDMTLAFVCSDPHDRSGVATCSPSQSFTSEMTPIAITVQASDNAGNGFDGNPRLSGTQQNLSFPIGLDKTPPTLTFTVVEGPGSDQATVTPTCDDALSGLHANVQCDPKVVSTLGSDPTVTLLATDLAGNETEIEVHIFDAIADDEPPTISNSLFSSGWVNYDQVIRFFCDDDRTVVSCGPDQTVTTEGANQTVIGVAIDGAGNQSPPLVVGPINIDKTPPSIVIASATPRQDLPYSTYEVTFSCSDTLSGVSNCSGPLLVNNFNNTQITASAYDNVGYRTDLIVNFADVDLPDITPPTIVASLLPPANGAGWVNGGSVVHYECADDRSGVFSCTGNQTIFASEVGQMRSGSVTDRAGNGPVVANITYNADVTLPEIAVATMVAGPGADEVTATFSCSDADSGVDTCEGAMILATAPTPEVGFATATDVAGNLTTIEVSFDGADLVPPTIDHVIVWQTPSSGVQIKTNPPDWYRNSSYWVRWICDDDQPGVTCSPDSPIHSLPDAPGGQGLTGEAVDAAGNRVTKTVTVNKDGSYPDVSVIQTPPYKGFNAWYNVDVVQEWTCSDPHSGILSCSAPTIAAGEGSFIEMDLLGSGTNNALLTNEPPVEFLFNIDKTAPVITGPAVVYSTPPNLKITVGCVNQLPNGVNAQSGMLDCNGDTVQTLFNEVFVDASTGASTYLATATDDAGNTASVLVDFSDKIYNTTPPAVSVVATPQPNAAGWNNTDVALDVTCVDPENQMAQGFYDCTPDGQLTAEGAGQLFAAFGKDFWQNQTDVNYGPVNIDKTSPTIVVAESPGPNPWEVSVDFICNDTLSGVAACEPGFDLELGYGDIAVSGSTGDLAGNTATVDLVIDGCQRSCDADCNGYVDERDVAEIMAAEGQTAEPGDVRDADVDGFITATDTNFCTNQCDELDCAEAGGPPYVVPEPGAMAGLLSGALGLLVLARRRERRVRAEQA